MSPDTDIAMCHGDLHSSNLFVDTRRDIWVIDYERTGFGPVLQDWVELENDVLTNLVSDAANLRGLPAYVQLLCDVLQTKTLGAGGEDTELSDVFLKEYTAVKTIRNAAKECSHVTDARQYYWGLLLNAVFRGTLLMKEYEDLRLNLPAIDRDQLDTQRQEIYTQISLNLLFAAMNCHRLDHWDEPWPPGEWKQVLSQSRAVVELPLSGPQFEKMVREAIPLIDPEPWIRKHMEILQQICRIEFLDGQGRSIFGTGFLIASDLVMTNYHVVKPLILDKDKPKSANLAARVGFRFDYRLSSDAQLFESPTICRLASDNWSIDFSPNAERDSEPTMDTLDYAILRLDRNIGDEPVGRNDRQRGWICLSLRDDGLLPNEPMIIVQHPDAGPLKLAVDTKAVIEENQAGTIVRYSTNTKLGSSGSPCFDLGWNLVALHHSGDLSKPPAYNAGTPIKAIIRSLRNHQLGHLVEGS